MMWWFDAAERALGVTLSQPS